MAGGGTQLAMSIGEQQVGEVKVWRLEFPFLPPSKNVYDQWPNQWKQSAKAKWLKAIARRCQELQLPAGLPKVGLSAKLVFAENARRDPQNYAQSLWHWVPDGLVRCGVLVDDREGCIEIGANWGLTFAVDGRKNVAKKHRQRTVVMVAARVPLAYDTVTGGAWAVDEDGDPF